MKIRITKVPDGSAPERVRAAWIGLELEALPMPENEPEVDLLSLSIKAGRGGCVVSVEDSLEILKQKNHEAYNWFVENIPPQMPCFSFGPDEYEIVGL